jgi:hypothetical protein
MTYQDDFQKLLEKIAITHDLRAAEQLVELMKSGGARRLPESVWVVYIQHRHGEGANVFRTEEGAKNFLYKWVSDYWNEVRGYPLPEEIADYQQPAILLGIAPEAIPDRPPGNQDVAIAMYFGHQRERGLYEDYYLERVDLED